MKFYSRKGLLMVGIIAFLLVITLVSFSDNPTVVFFILIPILSYLLWMWYDTYYTIADDQLLYKSALIKGSININTIVEIVKNKSMYSGIKPALSGKGIVIKYNKWDDIYMSPADIDLFISAIKEVNPSIKITE